MKTKKQLTKRIFAIFLCLIIAAGLMPEIRINVSAAAADITYTIDTGESITLTDTDGDGYYEIDTADELYAFSMAIDSNVNRSINAKLTADIVFNKNVVSEMSKESPDTSGFRSWYPIGYFYSTPFDGTFDGNGKTVSGLYFSNSTKEDVGMFGTLGIDGIVTNLKVADSYFCGSYGVGAVVGWNYGGTVENCSNGSNLVGGKQNIGGIVGINAGTVKKCYNTVGITGEFKFIGGVVGRNNAIVENCYNIADIECVGIVVGGVVGLNNDTVKNCYNIGNITGTSEIAGVTGRNSGTVKNCYNTGNINGTSDFGGVIGGITEGYIISNCYYLSETDDGEGGKTAAQFARGEVAYLLQQGVEAVDGVVPQVWGQDIGSQSMPVIDGTKVYEVKACDNTTVTYSNTSNDGAHDFDVNAVCSICGKVQMDYNGDGKLDVKDLVRLKNYLAGATDDIKTDIDDNGKIETADLVKLRKRLSGIG